MDKMRSVYGFNTITDACILLSKFVFEMLGLDWQVFLSSS